jgi:single-stranded-DNA-specific exonuclease
MHESLAGIIAGRIREATHRPTYVLTDTRDGLLKGSGRSIEAYHMHDALSECRDILTKFGGHKMAAGFTLKKENFDEFVRMLNENSRLEPEDFEETLHIDMELPLYYLSIPLVREFDRVGPFGTGNEEPLFAARGVELISGRIIGKNANVGKIVVRDEQGNNYEMMIFGGIDRWNDFLTESFGEDQKEKLYCGIKHDKMCIKIAYKADINEFRGEEKLQIILRDYKL